MLLILVIAAYCGIGGRIAWLGRPGDDVATEHFRLDDHYWLVVLALVVAWLPIIVAGWLGEWW